MQEPGSPIGESVPTVRGGAKGAGILWLRRRFLGLQTRSSLSGGLSGFGSGIAFWGEMSSGPGPLASSKCQEASVIEPGVTSAREGDATRVSILDEPETCSSCPTPPPPPSPPAPGSAIIMQVL